ncbi:MAG: SurA N-terminal domain-containing protein, partial [Actinobacteria bacterium]|nr:SurA N-terminal domain-containing protein [Actinomycetota bacterium]
MTDEPQVPPEPHSSEPGSSDAPAPSEEAGSSEPGSSDAAAGAEAGAAPADSGPPPPTEKGPSKLALLAVALVALLAGAGTAYALGHKGGGCPPKGDALKVEGEKISNAEFQRRVELLRALYDVRPPTDPAELAGFRADAAKGMAVATLVAHDVEKRKLQAVDKVVRDRLDRFIAQRYPDGGHDQFVQALGQYGVSEDDVLGEF